ncbi:hypothetical protein CR513_56386, partial [Mucuna pruriens]
MILGKDTFKQLKGSFSILSMEIYTDVGCTESVVDRRFTFGYCMFLGGNLVTWRSKKQNVIARSNANPEF